MEKQKEKRENDQPKQKNEWSQKNEPHHNESKKNSVDQREGSDADYAESIPGTQNPNTTDLKVDDFEDPNYNADKENRKNQQD